jgi:hypothetical protein
MDNPVDRSDGNIRALGDVFDGDYGPTSLFDS